jgi:hypothetical protein
VSAVALCGGRRRSREEIMSVRPRLRLLPAAILMALHALGTAQPAEPARPPDPLDPRAGVPPAVHRSPFDSYRRFADEPPLAWRDANREVARIGGWRTYAREAQDADAAPKPGHGPRKP